jgi:hypothetical protein
MVPALVRHGREGLTVQNENLLIALIVLICRFCRWDWEKPFP